MVYVTSNGEVVDRRPWSLGLISDIFWGCINFVCQFFSTLFGFQNGNGPNRGPRGSRGWGGGNGPGGPGNGGPRKRFGTMREIQDCSMPGGG